MPETVLQSAGRPWGEGVVGRCVWHILETARWRWGVGFQDVISVTKWKHNRKLGH